MKICSTLMPKTKSTIVMDEELWKRFRMIAIMNDMEISELVEQALKEKLERMKQLEEYESYNDVRNLRVPKSGIDADNKEKDRISKTIHQLGEEQPNEQQLIPEGSKHLHQSGLQQASELKEKMNKDDQRLLYLLETFPVISRINLPGLRFPATKNEIIECAERANTGKIIEILRENLPDRKYNSPEHIETERALTSSKNKYSFAKYFKGLDKTLKVKRRIGKFTVDTREIEQDQKKQLLQQQEKEFDQITKSK